MPAKFPGELETSWLNTEPNLKKKKTTHIYFNKIVVFYNNWENTKGLAPLVISLLTISLSPKGFYESE